jgi:aminodeoxyfutalosine deaminase
MDAELTRFFTELPKTELHVHLVGAASVDTVLELARRHPESGVPTQRDELSAYYEFTDFAHFIEVYVSVNALVREAADVEALVVGAARDMAAQTIRYAELTVTPDGHLLMGIAPDALAEALIAGRRRARAEHGVELAWVFDVPGELGLASGERTIDWVERYGPEGAVGFGLGGPEIGVPRSQFSAVFDRARELGLHSVPHAGETTGPETVRDAIDVLKAERVGHGINAAADPELLKRLAGEGIVLEVCPTSNLRTRAVTSLAEHPTSAASPGAGPGDAGQRRPRHVRHDAGHRVRARRRGHGCVARRARRDSPHRRPPVLRPGLDQGADPGRDHRPRVMSYLEALFSLTGRVALVTGAARASGSPWPKR